MVLASPEWWEPDTVRDSEWVLEKKCEMAVAFYGSPPLTGQGIEQSVPDKELY